MSAERQAEKAHTDPYCVTHCEPGFKHSQCGCFCNHKKPRLLDLYCCAGGASVGYHRAGFEVYGLDNNLRPDYPFPALRGDAIAALDFLLDGRSLKWWSRDARGAHVAQLLTLDDFSAVVGSPPCQAHTTLTKGNRGRGWTDGHTDLIAATRDRLIATGKPYVIENVVGAKAQLIDPVMLCGLSFDLRVFRHRLFESNVPLTVPAHLSHRGHRVAGWRHGVKHEGDMFAVYGDGGGKGTTPEWQAAMGIDWTTDRQAIAEAHPAGVHRAPRPAAHRAHRSQGGRGVIRPDWPGAACPDCGHVEAAHNFYSRCEGTLAQPDCRCLRKPSEIPSSPATTGGGA